MKKSTAVTLVISGALAAGCNDQPYYNSPYGSQVMTNNTYAPGYGYWHAAYHGWFPYPYNYYRPGFGYYHGGLYSDLPEASAISRSAPLASEFDGSHGLSSLGERGGISRGGFGSSAHGFFHGGWS